MRGGGELAPPPHVEVVASGQRNVRSDVRASRSPSPTAAGRALRTPRSAALAGIAFSRPLRDRARARPRRPSPRIRATRGSGSRTTRGETRSCSRSVSCRSRVSRSSGSSACCATASARPRTGSSRRSSSAAPVVRGHALRRGCGRGGPGRQRRDDADGLVSSGAWDVRAPHDARAHGRLRDSHGRRVHDRHVHDPDAHAARAPLARRLRLRDRSSCSCSLSASSPGSSSRFPAWVLALSLYILIAGSARSGSRSRRDRGDAATWRLTTHATVGLWSSRWFARRAVRESSPMRDALVYAVGVAVSPVPIAASIVILTSPRALVKSALLSWPDGPSASRS